MYNIQLFFFNTHANQQNQLPPLNFSLAKIITNITRSINPTSSSFSRPVLYFTPCYFFYICIEGVNFELSDGSHMYLFAIKLPFVNFPPSIHGTYVGHHVEYSLQGFLELNDAPGCIETARIPVIYLPFVTCMPMDGHVLREGAKKNQVFRRNNAVVEVIAEMIKPAYCPGKVKNNN